MNWIKETLSRLEAERLRRSPPAVGPAAAGRSVTVEGRDYICFASNNYLGLAGDGRLAEAASRAARAFGAGAGASRLLVGTLSIHRELEGRLAAFKGTEDAVLFSTGYQAGIGAVSALAGPLPGSSHRQGMRIPSVAFLDKLCHACLVDGARLSAARVRVYPHLRTEKLEELLGRETEATRRLVVTESLFSMDGDSPDLGGLFALAGKHDALLLLDEAHATGTLGPGGRGLAAEAGLAGEPRLVQMGTLSKALGSVGGFIAGTRELCEYLRNTARSYIYTTAPSPASVAAALEALKVLEEEPGRLERLRANVSFLAERLSAVEVRGPIVPVPAETPERALWAQGELRERGLWVPAIRPPSVPQKGSRLRVSLCSEHTREDLEALATALKDLGLA